METGSERGTAQSKTVTSGPWFSPESPGDPIPTVQRRQCGVLSKSICFVFLEFDKHGSIEVTWWTRRPTPSAREASSRPGTRFGFSPHEAPTTPTAPCAPSGLRSSLPGCRHSPSSAWRRVPWAQRPCWPPLTSAPDDPLVRGLARLSGLLPKLSHPCDRQGRLLCQWELACSRLRGV